MNTRTQVASSPTSAVPVATLSPQASPERAFTLGPANSARESQADSIAGQVSVTDAQTSAVPQIVKGTSPDEAGGLPAPESVARVLTTGGMPLDESVRADMEAHFARDFSRVRIHADETAAQSARDVHAKAYTAGEHIVFGSRRFSPETQDGRRLLAHELTHVAQQPDDWTFVQRDLEDWQRVQDRLENTRQLAEAQYALRQPRKLNPIEVAAAQSVFGSALDTSDIIVSEGGPMTVGGYARTLPDRIYFPNNTFYQPGYLKYLIHELTHVWHYQRGAEVQGMLWEAIVARYDYGGEAGLKKAWDAGKAFDDFTTEQQGDILADYYQILVNGGDVTTHEPYVNDVRSGNEKKRRYKTVEPMPAPTLDLKKSNADYRARVEADMIRQLKTPMTPNDPRAPARARALIQQFGRMSYWSIDYRERFQARRESDELVKLLFSRLSDSTLDKIQEVLGIKQPGRAKS